MSDTLEVVFEDVCQQDATELLLHLLSRADKVTNAEFSRNCYEAGLRPFAKDELDAVFDGEGDVTAFFKVNGLHFGRVKLPSSLIRLVKYGRKYDVDFSFDAETRIEACALMKDLHSEVKAVAKKYGVASLFGGLEPASDVETQYFCGEDEGPLMNG